MNAGNSTAGMLASAGSNAAGNIANMAGEAANARAASIVGGANAWSGAADRAMGGYNNYQSQQMLERIMGRNGSRGTAYSGGWQSGDDWY